MVKNVLSNFGKKGKEYFSKVKKSAKNDKYAERNSKFYNEKHRVSKVIKHKTKTFRSELLKKICIKQIGLIELLISLGIYKKTLMLKLAFVVVPFIILLIVDDVATALIVTIVDIFCCAFIFSITSTSRNDGMINGIFDYGKYKYIKAYRETVAILIMLFISLVLIISGHYFLKSFVPTVVGIVIE